MVQKNVELVAFVNRFRQSNVYLIAKHNGVDTAENEPPNFSLVQSTSCPESAQVTILSIRIAINTLIFWTRDCGNFEVAGENWILLDFRCSRREGC